MTQTPLTIAVPESDKNILFLNAIANSVRALHAVEPEIAALFAAIETHRTEVSIPLVVAYLAAQVISNNAAQVAPNESFDRLLMVFATFFDGVLADRIETSGPLAPTEFLSLLPTKELANKLQSQAQEMQLSLSKPVNDNVN